MTFALLFGINHFECPWKQSACLLIVECMSLDWYLLECWNVSGYDELMLRGSMVTCAKLHSHIEP